MAVVVLEARDIHKSYERGDEQIPVLNGLSVSLAAGSFTTLVGPSGCGKSTLLHICGAMDRPTSGEVRLEDESLTALDDDGLTRVRRERIGFVFQFFNLLPTLTVEQNIGLPLLLMGRSAQPVSDLSGQWAERVGISHRLNHFPSQLSGGEAQRVAIARALGRLNLNVEVELLVEQQRRQVEGRRRRRLGRPVDRAASHELTAGRSTNIRRFAGFSS